MATYSFVNVQASISGPGGVFSIGSDSGNAKEGITVNMAEEKDVLTIGADGTAMHSLRAGNAGKASVRLLKTSPVNALLSALYNFQRTSTANWGVNTIVVSDTIRGDVVTCQDVAFVKHPDINYADEAGMIEWEFNAGRVDFLLGAGIPDVNV